MFRPIVVLLTALILIADVTAQSAAGKMEIFLLIGQSNMAGRGMIGPADKIPHPRVFTLTKAGTWAPAIDPLHFDKPALDGVGLASSFARKIADDDEHAVVGLVPCAFGGTSLEEWQPGGKLYTEAVERTRIAMKSGVLAGILWHQGEADSRQDKVATYAARFSKMIGQLRADLGVRNVPVIVGETGRFRPGAEGINAVLMALPKTVPFCAAVTAEKLMDKGDKLHFNTPSLHEFGQRYARAWERLIAKAGPVGPSIVFKLDDLRNTTKARSGFARAYATLVSKDARAGFGVITDSLSESDPAYFELIKNWAADGRIEIWHHGYDHAPGEFSSGGYERQREHLAQGCALLAAKCGVKVCTFGAPFNADDLDTVRALNEVPQLTVWMFPRHTAGAKQCLLTRRADMEPKTGVVSYTLFVTEFNEQITAPYLIVQGHPPYWDEGSQKAFARIVEFCRQKGCRILTPQQLAQTLR